MPSVGFEPAIPASERPQTHSLDRAITWTGNLERAYVHIDEVRRVNCIDTLLGIFLILGGPELIYTIFRGLVN